MILKWNDNSCFSALWHYVSISFCKHKRIWNGDIVKKIHDNVESSRNFDYMKSNISAKQILYVRVLHNINATWKRPPFLNMFSKNIAFTSWKKISFARTRNLCEWKKLFCYPLHYRFILKHAAVFVSNFYNENQYKKCKRSLKL